MPLRIRARLVFAMSMLAGCNGGPLASAPASDAAAEVDPSSAPDAADVNAPSPSSEWRPLFDDLEAPVLSVWGASLERAFFVGEGGLVLQREQETWWQWAVPTSEALWWVWGRSSRDVFAGGEGGTLLHFDGNAWSQLNPGLSASETVWGIWGEGETIWVVGGRASTNGPGFVLRTRGDGWERVNVDTPNLYKVWGQSVEEPFVVGDDTSLYQWSGSALEELDLGEAGDNREPLFTVSGNTTGTVFAVGGISQGLAFELGSAGFELLPFATTGLNGVSVARGGDVAVVGLYGVIRERIAGEWVSSDVLSERHYHAVAVFDDGAYAVGGDLFQSGNARRGVIAMRGEGSGSTPRLTPRESTGAGDAGTPSPEQRDGAAPGPAAPDAGWRDRDASVVSDAGPVPRNDAAAIDGPPMEPTRPIDASVDASSDAAPLPEAGSVLPGAAELCTDDFECAPGLECWYVQGQGELRCVQLCEVATECSASFGSNPQCAPPGCQTVIGVCLRGEWVGCF